MQHVPFICLLYAFVLIYAPRVGPVNAEQAKLPGGYDNRDPRGQQLQLTGLGKRALGAHMNGFEAFAPFAVALFAALFGAPQRFDLICYIAIGFCVIRTLYVIAYLGDKATLRSGMWGLGMVSITALFVVGVIGH
ncbi:MAG TPA: MAPEG family protein [Kofleriaceae bacterium]|jgi:uncharacterized MAPEG superfamily protein